MKTFKNIMRAFPSGKSSSRSETPLTPRPQAPKSPSSPNNPSQLSKLTLNWLLKAVTYIDENFLSSEGIYILSGIEPETTTTENLFAGGIVSLSSLQSIKNVHAITNAILRTLAKNGPVVPCNMYDHFLSPLANFESLINTIPQKQRELFELLMTHFVKVTQNSKVNHVTVALLAAAVGIHLFRDSNDPYLHIDKDSFEYTARIKVFTRLITYFHTRNSTSKLVETNTLHSSVRTNAQSAAASTSEDEPVKHSIQDRSVKVSFVNPMNRPDQSTLRGQMAKYGNIINVSSRSLRFCFVHDSTQKTIRLD
jgi:hypothetical protein